MGRVVGNSTAEMQKTKPGQPSRPLKVARPTVTPGNMELQVEWNAPASDEPITHYVVRSKGVGDATHKDTIVVVPATSTTITGLTASVEYTINVRAVSDVGDGPWSDAVKGTPTATGGGTTGGGTTGGGTTGRRRRCCRRRS